MFKLKIASILFILFSFFTLFYINNTDKEITKDLTLINRTIVLDPGHGGLDNGASSDTFKEDDLNLKISIALKKELENRGATVYLTRDKDEDMTHRDHHYSKQDDMYLRIRKIDSYSADIFISIHLNASPVSKTWGSQVFYYKKSEKAKILANDIHSEMIKTTGSKKKIEEANFYVLRTTKTLGVLIECGFITNRNESGQLSSTKYQLKLVKSISDGIEKNFKTLPEIEIEDVTQ